MLQQFIDLFSSVEICSCITNGIGKLDFLHLAKLVTATFFKHLSISSNVVPRQVFYCYSVYYVYSADDELFHSILHNSLHVLNSTLPKETCSSYGLRRRRHNRELLSKSSRLVQSCFLVRMLYKDIY